MVLLSIFIVLAVGILAFAVITSVFNREDQQLLSTGNRSGMLAEKTYQRKLTWLRELEDDFAAGKIDHTDYNKQRSKLEREALTLLAQKEALLRAENPDAQKDVEEMIQDRRMERHERSAGFCSKCGQPLQRSDQFCPNCGSRQD